jgi:tRNA-Thr(GGU) m(6)t(6)A37 methyltransferase TsaA
MKEFSVTPIATVYNTRKELTDDLWGSVVSEIRLEDHLPETCFEGISAFSLLEIIYCFDQVLPEDIAYAGHPRGNKNYPLVGIFAQRKKDRPNRLGLCRVQLLEHKGRSIWVKYLDAIDGTPVLDIKPVFREFQPPVEVRQPEWVTSLMQNYWK